MNIKKTIKYILLAVLAIFFTKCGVELTMSSVDLSPSINPNPTHKMKVHGNFPFEDEVKLDMGLLFITTNPICDKKNPLAGIQFPHRFMKSFPVTIKDGVFESDIYLDSYYSGMCGWQAHGVYLLSKKKKDDLAIPNNDEKQSDNKISIPRTYIGVIAHENFKGQGKTLDVECTKRNRTLWKGLPKEITLTRYYCKYLGEISRPRDRGSKLKANISSSQKEIEINFINKGFKEWEK